MPYQARIILYNIANGKLTLKADMGDYY